MNGVWSPKVSLRGVPVGPLTDEQQRKIVEFVNSLPPSPSWQHCDYEKALDCIREANEHAKQRGR